MPAVRGLSYATAQASPEERSQITMPVPDSGGETSASTDVSPSIRTVRTCCRKRAPTSMSASSVSVHAPAPSQAPDQPANVSPLVPAAVRVTSSLAPYGRVQSASHSRVAPPPSTVITPLPSNVNVRATAGNGLAGVVPPSGANADVPPALVAATW